MKMKRQTKTEYDPHIVVIYHRGEEYIYGVFASRMDAIEFCFEIGALDVGRCQVKRISIVL